MGTVTPEKEALQRVLGDLKRAPMPELHALSGRERATDVIGKDARRYIVEYAVVREPEGLVVGAVAHLPSEGREGRVPTLRLVRPDGRCDEYLGKFAWPGQRLVLEGEAVEFCRSELRAVREAAASELIAQADHGFIARTVAAAGGPVYALERRVTVERKTIAVDIAVSVQLAACAWSQPLAVGRHVRGRDDGAVLEETVKDLGELTTPESSDPDAHRG